MDSATRPLGFSHVATSRDFATATSVLVVRIGTLVAEGYFRGSGRLTLNDTRSVTKSVTSLVHVIPRQRLVVVLTAHPDVGRHIDFGPMERLIADYHRGLDPPRGRRTAGPAGTRCPLE